MEYSNVQYRNLVIFIYTNEYNMCIVWHTYGHIECGTSQDTGHQVVLNKKCTILATLTCSYCITLLVGERLYTKRRTLLENAES